MSAARKLLRDAAVLLSTTAVVVALGLLADLAAVIRVKTAQLVQLSRDVAASDRVSIRARWIYGLRILNDPESMTSSGKSLRHGAVDKLVAAGAKAGDRLSEQEIQRRLRCARAYPKESQIRHAVTDFETWRDLVAAGFPVYDASDDEPDFDFRTTAERRRAAAQALAETDDQAALFPLDQFERSEATLKELADYARQQREMTERFAKRDRDRQAYLDTLITAVDGDLSATWEAAELALGNRSW